MSPHKSTTTLEVFHHNRNPLDRVRSIDPLRIITAETYFVRLAPDGKLYAAVAECSVLDQFSRKAGRSIARRKWFQGKRWEVTSPKFEDVIKTTHLPF